MEKLIITTFLVVLCVSGLSAKLNVEELKLTWGALYDIPSTKNALLASDSNYVLMGHDTELNVDLYSYGKDPRVSIMFDKHGNIAGVRAAYVISDLANTATKNGLSFPYRFDNKPMFANATYWNIPVVYNSVLFVSLDTLAAGGRPKIDHDSMVDSVWVKLDGNWTQLPENQCEAESCGFFEQGCFPTMGKHYFYGLTADSDCADHQGVFLLYENHALIGVGLIPVGSFTNGPRKWFESPPSAVVKMIVPTRPACLTKWTDDYGFSSLHMFFKTHPRQTFASMRRNANIY